MLVYLIESAIAFSIIYSFYKYVFFQTTYFEWNRSYFYFAVFISLIIPFIPFPYRVDFLTKVYRPEYILNPLSGENLVIYRENTSIFTKIAYWLNAGNYLNIRNILYLIYFSGVLRYTYLFINTQMDIYRLIKKSEKIKKEHWIQVKIDEDETAFSYFKYIFTGKRFEKLSALEQNNVLMHEKVHVFERHSLDVLIYEIYGIFFWFNPLVNKAKKTLKDLHEYIVDMRISKKENKYQYANLLIKLSTEKIKTKPVSLFSKHPLRDRLKLLAFPEGENLKKFRFRAGIPVIVFILLAYSFLVSSFNMATNSLQISNNSGFAAPVDYPAELISGFFENKEIKSNKNYKIITAHREMTYATESYQKIKSCKEGKVMEVVKKEDWGLSYYNITIKHDKIFSSKYKGLWKVLVTKGDKVKKGQEIGLMGDKSLYETFSFQLLKNSKPVDPVNFIK